MQEPEWPGFPLWSCTAFMDTCTWGQCDNRGRLGVDGVDRVPRISKVHHTAIFLMRAFVWLWRTLVKYLKTEKQNCSSCAARGVWALANSKTIMILVILLMASKAVDKTCQWWRKKSWHLTACWLYEIPYFVFHKCYALSAPDWQM